MSFKQEGIAIERNFLNDSEIDILRADCFELLKNTQNSIFDLGFIVEGINGSLIDNSDVNEYIDSRKSKYSLQVLEIIQKLHSFVCTLIKDELLLLNEQYIVKPPRSNSAFDWHCDGQYLKRVNDIACWIAMDDMNNLNGSLIIEKESPKCLILSKGSVVFMKSDFCHASGNNTSDAFRIAYLVQFTSEQSSPREKVALCIKLP